MVHSMSTGTAGDVKNAGAISWAGADAGEAALVERCVARDQAACAELVAAHQRMVYALAFHLLGDRDDALDARLAANGWREIHRDDDGAVFVRTERATSVLTRRTTFGRETARTALLASAQ